MLDAFFYQDARPQGNFGRAFLLPLTGSDTPYRRCRDWGRDGLVCAEAKQKGCHRGRGRRHRAGGLKISGWPSEVPLPGGRQHGAGGSCCSTGPANLVGSPGAAGQIPLPLTAYVWGVSCHAAGRFHRGGGLSFSLCSRSPWRARQKPLIAGIARPKGGPPGRARYDEGSYGHRQQSVTGRRFMCFASSAMSPHSGKRPVAYLPAGRHFFKEYPHAPR